MWGLLFLFVLVYTALAVALAVAAAWEQGYFYERTVEGVGWRSAAAAGVLTSFIAVWAVLEWRIPGRFDSIFAVTPYEVRQFDQFWSERKTDTGTIETLFRRHIVPPGRVEYVDE